MKPIYLIAALAVAAYVPAANAATSIPLAATGELSSPGTASYTFNAGAGSATLALNLDGYLSLDGDTNGADIYDDLFHIVLNGSEILTGKYALGGEGVSNTFTAPTGSTISFINNGFFNGGAATFSLPVSLLAGANSLSFSYTGLPQSTTDEGWGVRNVTVEGAGFAGAVPEPATWAMMILGFSVVGGSMRVAKRRSERKFDAKIKFILEGASA